MGDLVAWEEPVEDTSDAPTVIYDERGGPVRWLNHTTAELMADAEWILNHPDASGDRHYAHYSYPSSAIFDRFNAHVQDAPGARSYDGPPIHSSAWETHGRVDHAADLQRAWDQVVDDWFNAELRRGR